MFYEIQFLRTVSLAKRAGMTDQDALELAREGQTNIIFQNMVSGLIQALVNNKDFTGVYTQNRYLSEDVAIVHRLAGNDVAKRFRGLAEGKEEHIVYILAESEKHSALANRFIMAGLIALMASLFYFPLMKVSTIISSGAAKIH